MIDPPLIIQYRMQENGVQEKDVRENVVQEMLYRKECTGKFCMEDTGQGNDVHQMLHRRMLYRKMLYSKCRCVGIVLFQLRKTSPRGF